MAVGEDEVETLGPLQILWMLPWGIAICLLTREDGTWRWKRPNSRPRCGRD